MAQILLGWKAMGYGNEQKNSQLGMSYSTAAHRLKKQIMFRLVQKCGEDICFRCGQRIESYNELSVDHKQPWLYASNDLFWNLENVAFSHKECNRPDRPWLGKRIICPTGTLWCSNCKKFKPITSFYKDKYRWNGYRNICISCKSIQNKKRKRP